MFGRLIGRSKVSLKSKSAFWRPMSSTASPPTAADISKIRNIGIIAHIDAGKTTTTERMLFYSGYTSAMGEVHDGDTITDFMPQERERGITICSATITFPWKNHVINLIDTPGHVDFTVEVERSLRVLDGAVTILDASAGVEAQTLTVWRQANKYKIPRLIFLNKMDKPRADFNGCLKDIEEKLLVKPLVCQIPVMNPRDKSFCGVFDLVRMQELIWDVSDGSRGAKYRVVPLEQSRMLDIALEKRSELVEALGALDDSFAEKFVLSDVEPGQQDVEETIRKSVMTNAAVPLLCGSSYKNIGVQPLLNSIVNYLPDPSFCQPAEISKYYSPDDSIGLVFKIIHTKFKGALTFVRMYQGEIKSGQKIHIMNRDLSEKSVELLVANADEYLPTKVVSKGNIAAISGLKETITGDTIIGSHVSATRAIRKAGNNSPLLFGISQIEPVFQCSIEAPSMSQQKQLDFALECLQREDPSLVVSTQEETGQTIISGMGQLHIDVIKDRIQREYKVEPFMGKLQIAYRETISEDIKGTHFVLDKTLANTKHYVELEMDIKINREGVKPPPLSFKFSNNMNIDCLRPQHSKALEHGVKMALGHGPILGFPLADTHVVVTHFSTTNATSMPMITAAASQCIQKALRNATNSSLVHMLEPYMRLEISLPTEHIGMVLSDLAKRRASIEGILERTNQRVIVATCPLNELKEYSTDIRTLTSGRATFNMEIDHYKMMNATEQGDLLRRLSGF